jgi:hypothetical protein
MKLVSCVRGVSRTLTASEAVLRIYFKLASEVMEQLSRADSGPRPANHHNQSIG